MKHVAKILAALSMASFAELACLAQTADDAEGGPVTPIIPVATAPVSAIAPVVTLWTIKPITIELLRALTDGVPNPEKIKALVAQLSGEKLKRMEVALFIADVDAWAKFTDLLSEQPAKNPQKFGETWLEVSRQKLRAKLDKEGYSPGALEEAQSIMNRLKSPSRPVPSKLNLTQ